MMHRIQLVWLVIVVVISGSALCHAGRITPSEAKHQAEVFQKWWEEPIVWKYSELPLTGIVPTDRVPYSGHIYPDGWGGTATALRKYDKAFYRGSARCTSWERQEINATKEASGLFRIRRTPDWAGHCNGWTAAAIRHAEPQRSVRQYGVVFTPSDIKALLAELYTYQDVESLAGEGTYLNAAIFHVIMTNWIGRKKQALGMDSELGKEVWNYPIYSYRATAGKVRGRQVTIKMNLGYVHYLDEEMDRATQELRYLSFHYTLYLNSQGEIIGGDYLRGSHQLDMLWAAKPPAQGGTEGNKGGNPYLNARQVLALWHASVDRETHLAWDAARPTRERPKETGAPEEQLASADPSPQSPAIATTDAAPTETTAATPPENSTSTDEVATSEMPAASAQADVAPTAPQVTAVAISDGQGETPTAEATSQVDSEPTPATTQVATPTQPTAVAAAPSRQTYQPVPDGFSLKVKPLQLRR